MNSKFETEQHIKMPISLKACKSRIISYFNTVPKYTKVIFTLFIISIIIHVCAIFSFHFADFFTEKIACIFRSILATLTGVFPFSLAETFLMMLPIIIVYYFVFTHKYYIKENHSIRSLLYGMLSLLMALYTVAVFTFLTGYSNSTLDKKIDIKAQPVTAQQLYDTSMKVYTEIEKLSSDIEYGSNNLSVMPQSISEMSDSLLDAYDTCCQRYDFLHNINAKIKPVALSEAMSYTHITGVYTFFTGEANIDAAFPDFTLPYTAAHEFAHQRGIARENEANFVAFLVCIGSSEAYIRYSGYMNMLQYLMNALYSADKELYSEFMSEMNKETKREFSAYSSFFSKYRDSAASKLSEAVNDTYLKLQGTEGTKSYGMVVDLAVAYYADQNS